MRRFHDRIAIVACTITSICVFVGVCPAGQPKEMTFADEVREFGKRFNDTRKVWYGDPLAPDVLAREEKAVLAATDRIKEYYAKVTDNNAFAAKAVLQVWREYRTASQRTSADSATPEQLVAYAHTLGIIDARLSIPEPIYAKAYIYPPGPRKGLKGLTGKAALKRPYRIDYQHEPVSVFGSHFLILKEPGKYSLDITGVGFFPYTEEVTVEGKKLTKVDAKVRESDK